MPPREPSCSRILPPSARDFPIICPGASGTISERDSQFESALLQRRVHCEPEFLSMTWRQPFLVRHSWVPIVTGAVPDQGGGADWSEGSYRVLLDFNPLRSGRRHAHRS
jgi:hypothetical protein